MTGPRTTPAGTVSLRVPATSANLGPAFDAAGLALAWFDDVEVRTRPTGCSVRVTGEGADTVARDESHLVVRALRTGLEHAGLAQPGLELTTTNRIPHGRGLGSSAAATIAGLVAARELADTVGRAGALDDAAVIALACAFEGHADNVGATLLGGLTLVWEQPGGPGAVRLDVDPRIRPVLMVPHATLSTSRARGLIPDAVPHAAAVHNVARSALLVTALTARPDLLLPATDDQLHQAYRSSAFPASMALVARLRERGLAAVISGAGPSVLVLTTAGAGDTVPDEPGWVRHQVAVEVSGTQVIRAPRSQ
jgi:homoserine kinase